MTTTPCRLIVCVDGTWFDPDGGASKKGNITNVYRLYASVKEGECVDGGKQFLQEKIYVPGIGSEDNLSKLEKLYAGIYGLKCFDQIKQIYRRCCRLKNPGDEVWLYGFSRGAYVVRAVSGLLHYTQALISADLDDSSAFESDYRESMKVYEQKQKSSNLMEGGKIHHLFTAKTRQAATIRFVGTFDTVKAVDDQSRYDITFNDSIQHMRAALALNEERKHMDPEGVWPSWGNQTSSLRARSFVQAWFVGTHLDIGGSAERDGLALYPLQWMIIESLAKGLHFEFTGNHGGRAPLQNPLEIIGLNRPDNPEWSYTTENNMTVVMRDIRRVHEPGSIFGSAYEIKLNRARGLLARFIKPRQPFERDGKLKGFCKFAPQGTIIHPSVYLVIDQELNKTIDKKLFPFSDQLEDWREKMLGTRHGYQDQGFWNAREDQVPEEMPAIRVLVCGNTGVGKSELINQVFGVKVTDASDQKRGEHNVDDEIKWESRPDLIVHDSRGFEAGGVEEFDVLENFLQKRSREVELSERIHIIWVCAEAQDSRLIQRSTEKLFESIARYAEGIPVVVVATKMDEFMAVAEGEAKRKFRNEGIKFGFDDVEQYAQQQLTSHLCQMEEQLNGIGGRFNACIATSMHDPQSIDNLNNTTRESFTSETVRFLYVRAQQRDIDSKVEYAVDLIVKTYRQILGSATSTAGVPGAPTTTRTTAAIRICHIVIGCFGLSTVTAQTALDICKANVWDDLANNIVVAVAEGSATMGVVATVLTGGIPFFLVPAALNIAGVVQATMRLTLMLACDMILIMNVACRKASMKCFDVPDKHDVEVAARAYRDFYKEVHREIKKKVVPNPVRAFQVGKVALGFKEVIDKYKNVVVERSGSNLSGRFDQPYAISSGTAQSLDSSTTVAADDKEDFEIITEGYKKLKLDEK